jgi:hypothetical protein
MTAVGYQQAERKLESAQGALRRLQGAAVALMLR